MYCPHFLHSLWHSCRTWLAHKSPPSPSWTCSYMPADSLCSSTVFYNWTLVTTWGCIGHVAQWFLKGTGSSVDYIWIMEQNLHVTNQTQVKVCLGLQWSCEFMCVPGIVSSKMGQTLRIWSRSKICLKFSLHSWIGDCTKHTWRSYIKILPSFRLHSLDLLPERKKSHHKRL